jgi:hypothetical protein
MQPTLQQAIRQADIAMYQAKRAGGNAWALAPQHRVRNHGAVVVSDAADVVTAGYGSLSDVDA